MGKHDKVIEKLLRRPPPADLRWSDFAALMASLGFETIQGSGSRCKFFNRELGRLVCLHCPHPGPNMDKGAVAQVRDFLLELKLIE